MNEEKTMTTERLAEELLTLWRILRNLYHPVRQEEITPEQYWLLRLLSRSGSLTIGELAAKLEITTSSATAACKRLERDGLLTRERQSDDERIVRVALTEQGTARLQAWHERKVQALARMLNVLDAREQEQFQEMLERVLEAASAPVAEDEQPLEEERQP